jgi:hypothetical protein
LSADPEIGILSEQSYTVTDKDSLVICAYLKPSNYPAGSEISSRSSADTAAGSENNLKRFKRSGKSMPEGSACHGITCESGFIQYLLESPPELPGKTEEDQCQNPYTFKGLERGKMYYFVVTAVANSMESKESDELSLKQNNSVFKIMHLQEAGYEEAGGGSD